MAKAQILEIYRPESPGTQKRTGLVRILDTDDAGAVIEFYGSRFRSIRKGSIVMGTITRDSKGRKIMKKIKKY